MNQLAKWSICFHSTSVVLIRNPFSSVITE